MSTSSTRPRLSLAQTSRLVARALGLTPAALMAGLRTATLDDLPRMLDLRARVLGPQLDWDDRAYLLWRYRLGRASQGGGDCWVLMRHEELIGMVGTQDMVLRCGGEASPALSLMDIMIQPTLEDAGLGAWLNLVLQERADTTLAIGANPNSIGMVSRLFDALPNRRSHIHPLHLGDFLGKRIPLPVLPDLLALLLDPLLSLGRTLLLAPGARGIQVKRMARFDHSVEALEAQLARSDALVHCTRTPQQLNWRLLDNPCGPCDVWGAWSQGQLVGYIAMRLTPLDDGERQAMVLVDTVVAPLPGGRPALRALLWKALAQASRAGAEYAVMTSYRHDVEQELTRVGFRQHAHPFETLGWNCRDERFKALAASRPDWTLSELHTDRI